MGTRWTCPHCQTHSFLEPADQSFMEHGAFGVELTSKMARCANPSCARTTLHISTVHMEDMAGVTFADGRTLRERKKRTLRLIPPAGSRMDVPEFVPVAIREDMREAGLILELSPKASATLSRRCLQGMIRDYWGVPPGKLVAEIKAIEDKTDALTWKAIDTVRRVGNIGAHMEADIDHIVEVDPGEAEQLYELIQMLIQEWYVARHRRQERLDAVVALGVKKDSERRDKSNSGGIPDEATDGSDATDPVEPNLSAE